MDFTKLNESIDKFLPLEKDLFFALNGSDSVILDNAIWTYTGVLTWVPMVLFILYILFKKQKLSEAFLVLGTIVLLVVLTDQLSSSFFKPLFKRFRPTHHPDYMNLVDVVKGYRGGRYGFISGHATNSFGIAVFLSLLFRNKLVTIFMLFWAILNSYARIYLGVHFISDIVVGIIFGSLTGLLVYEIYIYMRVKLFKIPKSDKRKSIYSKKDGKILGIGIISYITLVLLFSSILSTIPHSITLK